MSPMKVVNASSGWHPFVFRRSSDILEIVPPIRALVSSTTRFRSSRASSIRAASSSMRATMRRCSSNVGRGISISRNLSGRIRFFPLVPCDFRSQCLQNSLDLHCVSAANQDVKGHCNGSIHQSYRYAGGRRNPESCQESGKAPLYKSEPGDCYWHKG